MPLGLHRRYYCVNTAAGCRYALADHVYTQADYRRDPHCRGLQGDGCGAALFDGGFQRLPWRAIAWGTLGLAAVAAATAVSLRLLFPSPLTGIAFAAAGSSVVEGQTGIAIVLQRSGTAAKGSAAVRYRTEDGTARAGQDYVAQQGVLNFADGETTLRLEVPLLPGRIDHDAKKSFSVSLSNVEGTPRHVVVIAPPVADADTLTKADALVRSVSGLSIDIAGLYVKRKTLHRIANSSDTGKVMGRAYSEILRELDANMEQARRRYLETLKDLTAVDRRTVARTFDAWDARLDQLDLQQQRAATRIARHQYDELLAGGAVQMDLWALQLSEAIPKPTGTAPGLKPTSTGPAAPSSNRIG